MEFKLPRVLVYVRKANVDEMRAWLHNVEEIVVDPDFGTLPLSSPSLRTHEA